MDSTKTSLVEARNQKAGLQINLESALWQNTVKEKEIRQKDEDILSAKRKNDKLILAVKKMDCESKIAVQALNSVIDTKNDEIVNLHKEVDSLKLITETQVRFTIYVRNSLYKTSFQSIFRKRSRNLRSLGSRKFEYSPR